MLFSDPSAVDYAENMGLTSRQMVREGVCIQCHGTPLVAEQGSHSQHGHRLPYVSCESCHNPSGGNEGWLAIHSIYGAAGTARQDESGSHRKQRIVNSTAAGLLGSLTLFDSIRRCADCHLPSNPELFDAGHEQKGFKFERDSFLRDDIRHNFHQHQAQNELLSSLWIHPPGRESRDADARLVLIDLLLPLVAAEVSLETIALNDQLDSDHDLALTSAERILESAETIGEMLEFADWYDDANSALEDLA